MNRTKTNRRNFLRGIGGAVLSLPWMESLSFASSTRTIPQRLAIFYVPIGVVRRGFFPGETDAELINFRGKRPLSVEGAKLKLGLSKLDELTPTMSPLERMKSKVTLITGMDRIFQTGTDVHAQCASCFLSSAPPYSVKSSAWPLARTLDHVVADTIGNKTPFRTLEISCNSHTDNRESIHFDNISWYGTGHVAPSIRDPGKLYRRLFGTSEIQSKRDITDLVLEDARSMKKRLGHSDRKKFEEYFDGIRTIEQQMDKLAKMKSELSKVNVDEPPESRLPRGEYIRLMGDLMVIALQTGLTNVASMMIGPERWDTPMMFDGLFDKPMSHHQMSHNMKKFKDELLKVDHFHMEQFAYLVEKMDGIKETDGTSLLDNTLFTYGSGLGDGATHQYNDLPIIVAGSGGGRFVTGQHLHVGNGTPLSNLWLTQAQTMGVPIKSFADSTNHVGQLLS